MATPTGRLVYIDAGTNWGDTLDLFRVFGGPHSERSNWEVYGFEASPRIQPYVERLTRWKNGLEQTAPETCMPRAGSTFDLMPYAASVGCGRDWVAKMKTCMAMMLRKVQVELPLEPELCALPNVQRRLAFARQPHDAAAAAPRYTFVPAAVGGKQSVLPESTFDTFLFSRKMKRLGFGVQVVDIARFLSSFRQEDHVIMKIDVPGHG